MRSDSTRATGSGRARLMLAAAAVTSILVAACTGGSSPAASTSAGGGSSPAASTAVSGQCDIPYDSSVLDARPIPASLDPAVSHPDISQMAANNTSGLMGSQPDVAPVWYDTVKITPDQVQQVCAKHLKAVYLDWADALYNQIFRSAMRQTLSAMGINLIRITSFSFDPNGLAGNLASVLPLHPDIIFTGGTIDTKQYASLMKPAADAGIKIISWGVGADGWQTGQGKQITTLVGYDWYALGQQMAIAVHNQYPNGATLGWLHWINNIKVIALREQGFLDGLKNYPNIKIVSDGGPPDPAGTNSGYSDPNAAQATTQAFILKHPDVNVLFAPWEDPPGLGEEAAIKSSGKEGKIDIVTMDLGTAGATELAANGTIKVDMAQDIYDGGRVEAIAAGLDAIGATVPPYIIVPTFATTKSNLKDAWDMMHGPEFPCPAANC